MFRSTKFRTTITILAAASTVAGGVGPIASASAQKNIPGRFQRSSEAQKLQWDRCVALAQGYLSYSELERWANAHGFPERADLFSECAEEKLKEAEKLGCSWAK